MSTTRPNRTFVNVQTFVPRMRHVARAAATLACLFLPAVGHTGGPEDDDDDDAPEAGAPAGVPEAEAPAGSDDAAAGDAATDDAPQPAAAAQPDAAQPAEASADESSADTGSEDGSRQVQTPDCIPDRWNTVIFGKDRLDPPSVPRFRNYLAQKCAAATGWPSRQSMHNQGDGSASVRSRAGAKIDLLVIHETGGANGYYNPSHHAIHFLVDNDGTVYQLADLEMASDHASHPNINNRSIGIEVANGEGSMNVYTSPADCPAGRTCTKLDWALPRHLLLPHKRQLESLRVLVDYLLNDSAIRTKAAIPNHWFNFQYTKSTGDTYFLLGTQGAPASGSVPSRGVHVRYPLPQPDPNRLEAALAGGQGGVLSHSIIRDRVYDGTSPLLYTWLVLAAGTPAAGAYDMMQCVLKQKVVDLARDAELKAHFKFHENFEVDRAQLQQALPLPRCAAP